jgi:hypothetical protein
VRLRLAGLAVGALVALNACGGSDSSASDSSAADSSAGDPDAGSFSAAADQSTCVADAKAVDSFPHGYPSDFPMPPQTVVFSAQDRGAEGVVVTGVTDLAFKDVLAALNGPAQDAGYKVTSGETEEHDAEADWEGNGYRGRWAIRESAQCAGETVVQVLSSRQ